MYERFYQLRSRPFALSPDPDFLYPSRVHREALDYLRFAIEGHAGFVVITGEIGSGKTTLLQVLLRTLDGQTSVIRLVNTLLTGVELLESMLLDLGVTNPPTTKPAMLRELAHVLVEQRAQGRRVLWLSSTKRRICRQRRSKSCGCSRTSRRRSRSSSRLCSWVNRTCATLSIGRSSNSSASASRSDITWVRSTRTRPHATSTIASSARRLLRRWSCLVT